MNSPTLKEPVLTGRATLLLALMLWTPALVVNQTFGQERPGQNTKGGGTGVLELSAAGGGNSYTDLTNAPTPAIDGQIGVARNPANTGTIALVVASSVSGPGTNSWGQQNIDIPQGLHYLGNWLFAGDLPYALNLNNAQSLSTIFYEQWGHRASTLAAAYGYQSTNLQQNLVQPYMALVNGNPWSGAPVFQVKAAFTNLIHGQLAGTNDDGMAVYSPQFGFGFYQIGDAYKVGEANEAPSQGLLGSDDQLGWYFTENTQRPGDSTAGQVPFQAIDYSTAGSGHGPKVLFPTQVANTWMFTNANWQNAMMIDETAQGLNATWGQFGPSAVIVSNASIFASNIYTGIIPTGSGTAAYTAPAHIVLNTHSGNADPSDINILIDDSVAFNCGNAVWSFDSSGAQRLGFGKIGANYPMLLVAAGAPFQVAHSSAAALDNGGNPGAQTVTPFIYADASTVVITNSQVLAAQSGIALGTGATISWGATNTAPASTNWPPKAWLSVTAGGSTYKMPLYQ